MGMYTELVVGVELKQSTPIEVTNILKEMFQIVNGISNDGESDIKNTPDHLLFRCDRWRWMLFSDSYYFDGKTNTEMLYDKISKAYHLTIRCDLKDYTQEIEYFMDFISPHLETRGFLGYKRYEEDDFPRLIYKGNKGIYYIDTYRE